MPDLVMTIIVGLLGLLWLVAASIIHERIQSKSTAKQLMINFFLAVVGVIIGAWFFSLIF